MFQDSPFTGACEYAALEVLIMILGSLALGVLLGFLIWGWTRRKLLAANIKIESLEGELAQLRSELQQLQGVERNQRARVAGWTSLALSLKDDDKSTKSPSTAEPEPESRPKTASTVKSIPEVEIWSEPVITEPEPIDKPDESSLKKAAVVMGREVPFNDLTIIEGIGPAIAGVLNKAGISSWTILASTSKHILRVILDEAGPQFRIHKPKTWPRQAEMAANGEWKKLKAYQDVLVGGK